MPTKPAYEELEQRVKALEKRNAELERNHQKHQQLVENLNDVVYIMDMNGRITYISSNVERLAGLRPEEILGRCYSDFLYVEDKSVLEQIFRRILSGAEAVTEHPYITKSRGIVWGLNKARPVYEQGEVVGIQGALIDITERKNVEETIKSERVFLFEVLENIGEAVIVCDEKGRIVRFNEAARQLHGLPEEPISPDQWAGYYDLFKPDGVTPLPMEEIPLFRALQGERVINAEIVVAPKGGEPHTLICNAHVLTNESGSLIGAVVAMHDITERKKAEKALETMVEMLDTAPSCITVHDTGGQFLYANQKTFELHGYEPEEFLAINLRDLDVPESTALAEKRFRQIAEKGEARFEVTHYRKDGSAFPLEVLAKTIHWNGRPAVLSIADDITSRKQAEQKTARLQEQFYQAQKMESIGRLAGGVAHDLNNLLSPVLGYGEMLLEDCASDDFRRRHLKEIVSAGKRAQALVRQLLAFSRKQSLQFQTVNMNTLLTDFKKLLRRTLREDIIIRMKLAPSVPEIRGDIGQLEQVIMNLAVNAQDAMPAGGRLTIETARVELDESYARQKRGVTPGSYVMAAVSDTGIGMDETILAHLFEPFFTTKEKGKGTGLGMSTAYGIAKQHEGNIWAYSEPGMGTTIKVYLPVTEEVREVPPSSFAQKQEETKGSETVLLVEDDQQVRNLASIILDRHGYNVLVAGSGREALSLLESHGSGVHLLLTDLIMPDMNGKELFDRISVSDPAIRVLYMSGYTGDAIAHHGVIEKGVNFIEKPFSVKALAAKVREVLDQPG